MWFIPFCLLNMKVLFVTMLLFFGFFAYSQESVTEKVWRLNFLNPGIEVELPVTVKSTVSANAGVGYGGSYPNLSETDFQSGLVYTIAPFLDLQYKRFYNLEKRAEKNKHTNSNSGNFISARFITRGNSITDNFVRKADMDFAAGPTWGLQRAFGKIHLLFDLGPQFYFDTKGNSGFWPIMIQLNIGLNLNTK